MSNQPCPRDVEELEERLSRPTDGVIRTLAELDGDLLFLGVGGKMGPTMARMARRASDEAGKSRRVIGVSRFSSDAARRKLESWGVETIACDLLDEAAVQRLPDAPLVVAMTGMKFGATQNPELTWAMNCLVPVHICRRFRHSRIAAFSSGNVYGLTPAAGGGSVESDPLRPVGEYSVTVLGRERMFSYFSQTLGIPLVLLRLNYATELRYGVQVDLARWVLEGRPIDVTMGYANVIWQGDANAMSLQALSLATSPARVLNIAGPEILRIRDVAERFGERLGQPARFTGTETSDALLNNARASHEQFGPPTISSDQLLDWTADWVRRGGDYLAKPTHFESRDGKF